MLKIDPSKVSSKDLHQYLVGAVAPRPIAFVSTIDENGVSNLAPFSYFNVFSSSPPVLGFSIGPKKGRENSVKDTLKNIRELNEVVVNVVSYHFVRQMALTSIEYPEQVDEFTMSGLTPVPSERVRPFRVSESPIQFECKVSKLIPLNEEHPQTGYLILCDVVLFHLTPKILDENGHINPHKVDLVGRMGRAYYTRASGESIYSIFQARNEIGIGFQHLPSTAKNSKVLTANNLGHLASLIDVPDLNSIKSFKQEPAISHLLNCDNPIEALHIYAKCELSKQNLGLAARAVWLAQYLEDIKFNIKDW